MPWQECDKAQVEQSNKEAYGTGWERVTSNLWSNRGDNVKNEVPACGQPPLLLPSDAEILSSKIFNSDQPLRLRVTDKDGNAFMDMQLPNGPVRVDETLARSPIDADHRPVNRYNRAAPIDFEQATVISTNTGNGTETMVLPMPNTVVVEPAKK